jgi:replication factor A1
MPEAINLKTGKTKVRKHVILCDHTLTSISLTLWGENMVEGVDVRKGDILAIKGARVSDFGGLSLNAADDHATVFINLKSPAAAQLRKWFSNSGASRE